MIFSYSSLTKAGPRSVNEDAVGVWSLEGGRVAAAVADGLGGMGSGELASSLAVEMTAKAVGDGRDLKCYREELVHEIHAEVLLRQEEHPATRTMATTLSLVIIENGRIWGAHCGDTRVMVARRNGIKRLTRDHSEAQRLLDQGKLTRQEYVDYPRKNILYSALGGAKALEVQLFEFDIEVGDWVIMTSDGFHQVVCMKEFRDIAQVAISPDDYIGRLIALMDNKRVNDNYSAVVIYVGA